MESILGCWRSDSIEGSEGSEAREAREGREGNEGKEGREGREGREEKEERLKQAGRCIVREKETKRTGALRLIDRKTK